MNGFSVIMPTYNQECFIRRAISSLFQQSYVQWELIIINDGSTDNTDQYIADFLDNPQIVYIKYETNRGMGYAINQGLAIAKYNHIAYLPSDDFYYVDHLKNIKEKFEESANIALVYSGMKYDLNDTVSHPEKYETLGLREGYSLQLVQAAHIKTEDQWLERSEWITENLFLMYWQKLTDKGEFVPTGKISSYWTNHPNQRHKLIFEKYGGGVNHYRSFYKVQDPIKIRISDFKFIDEEEVYKNFRNKIEPTKDSLKILLVGELAFHPDRIYALEEAGHQLYGLWVKWPTYCSTTVGHLPFGNVIDIPYENYQNKIKEIKPDIIYALLNWGAISLAYEVRVNCPEIPFVWHFKEGPHHAIREGLWKELVYLITHADGNIFINEEIRIWYKQFIPQIGLSYILDGDLPKIDYFKNSFSKRFSESDNEIHTVIPGRLVGISPEYTQTLAQQNIHIHIYTENYHDYKMDYLNYIKKLSPNYIHLHSHCIPENWVKEFSQYDAGWLHCIDSQNNGSLLNATWDDLNIPARMTCLAAAGLPMIQKNNIDHIVAMQSIIRQKNVGVFFDNINDLCFQLKNNEQLSTLRENLIKQRYEFSFDYHLPDLIAFFKKVILQKINN
ncbi:glycosyltransferase family 2 protein [Dysgonomonas sp. ZJ709]|uniref:glycosyltransferase family 2 protein n=1 Tax=Dysgonomonas sp. ZJ709 TaxID=2709797 RepID=UPI0013ED9790|nr:glycosyltransferase family 2 protein [Dysgonomonas sp. ZJ709]